MLGEARCIYQCSPPTVCCVFFVVGRVCCCFFVRVVVLKKWNGYFWRINYGQGKVGMGGVVVVSLVRCEEGSGAARWWWAVVTAGYRMASAKLSDLIFALLQFYYHLLCYWYLKLDISSRSKKSDSSHHTHQLTISSIPLSKQLISAHTIYTYTASIIIYKDISQY